MGPDESDRRQRGTEKYALSDEAEVGLTADMPAVGGLSMNYTSREAAESGSEVDDVYKSRKIEFIHRKIIELKILFDEMSRYTGGPAYLLIDDLYHIRPSDQPYVVDYFHRITKGTNTWLKVGTIRHRTTWYLPGKPPTGIKLDDDADEIDLDVTLEKYDLTKAFLIRILETFCREVGMKTSELLSDGAKDRLVLASGGVARDFLSLVRRSIDIARQRLAGGDRFRGERISAEDVNKAAGELDAFKQEDFRLDTSNDEAGALTEFFGRKKEYCLENTKSNCFLVDKDAVGKDVNMIKELVDLKFLHHVRGRVTVRDKPGKYTMPICLISVNIPARESEGISILLNFGAETATTNCARQGLYFRSR